LAIQAVRVAARVGVDAGASHRGESLGGKAFGAGEEPAPVGPLGLDLAASAAAVVPGHALADSVTAAFESRISWNWSTTTCACGHGVGDGAPVGGARVDRDELDPLPELFGLGR
jgi:hypothetical protein